MRKDKLIDCYATFEGHDMTFDHFQSKNHFLKQSQNKKVTLLLSKRAIEAEQGFLRNWKWPYLAKMVTDN